MDVKRAVLQCVGVRCSVLQCVAVCCSVLQCVAVQHSTSVYTSLYVDVKRDRAEDAGSEPADNQVVYRAV